MKWNNGGAMKCVANFLDLAMNRHQVPEAANRYLTETYIQHNPNVADGRQAFIDAFTVFLKKYPGYIKTTRRNGALRPWISSGSRMERSTNIGMCCNQCRIRRQIRIRCFRPSG